MKTVRNRLLVLSTPLFLTNVLRSQPANVATPPVQVVRLHYDYMVQSGGPVPHSDAPGPAAIQMVVDAFAKQGVKLLIDPVHTAIPEKEWIIFSDPQSEFQCQGVRNINADNSVNFYDLKTAYLHSHEPNLHYAVFGYAVASPDFDCGPLTGISELPGENFAVGVAQEVLPRPPDGSPYLQNFPYYPYGIGITPTPFIDGGTFMHELGHNIGLQHGGGDDLNYKPNYLSVMNYDWQQVGLLFADTPGSTVANPDLTRLDYSDRALPTLSEDNLNEVLGIDTGTNAISYWFPPWGVPPWAAHNIPCPDWYSWCTGFVFPNVGSCGQALIAGAGPVDWNGDGAIESTAGSDLFGCSPDNVVGIPLSGIVSVGFDDWAEVRTCIANLCSFPGFPGKRRRVP